MVNKDKDPLLTWLLIFATGGIYLLYWIFRVGRTINRVEGIYLIPVGRWISDFVLYIQLFIFTIIFMIDFGSAGLLTLVCIAWLKYIYEVITVFGKYIAFKQYVAGHETTFTPILGYLLFLFGMLGVAYLQANLNKVFKQHGEYIPKTENVYLLEHRI
ncbi:MAG: hypothetical protein OEZ39_13170 [Gammaproteobacteria bacterium]|nr:hypothetical protein [Gammaproteobacteria bacterium]MDH5652800.1 hypothetical protein [Gammaproteobacteria bacterium]